jgi:hypothetical protein
MIDDQVHGPVAPGDIATILDKYTKKEKGPKAPALV